MVLPDDALSPYSDKDGVAGLPLQLKSTSQPLGLDFTVKIFKVLKSPVLVRRLNLHKARLLLLSQQMVPSLFSGGISGLRTGREGAQV